MLFDPALMKKSGQVVFHRYRLFSPFCDCMESPSLVQAIKAKAKELGFDRIGITTPDEPTHYDIYQSWIKSAFHGEMEYLSNSRSQICRRNPRELLPECQSIIVLATRYANPNHFSRSLPSIQSQTNQLTTDSSSIEPFPFRKDCCLCLGKRLPSCPKKTDENVHPCY